MKHLFISEILLVSQKEKTARKIMFDPKRTLIRGKNHTGKSCLIKSIYRTFGADVTLHPNFKRASVASLLKFTVDGIGYQILRDDKSFAIFDREGNFLEKFENVTRDLAPYLSELFDFKPLFQTKGNEFIIPSPAILFLPFYVDQDESWKDSWASFEKMAQFKDYRTQAIKYHSGLRPNEYYLAKKEVEKYMQAILELDKEQKLTNQILAQVKEKLSEAEFDIDVEAFKEEIKELLIEADKLKKREEALKHALLDFYNIKAIIEAQIEIVKRAIIENKKDLDFASVELSAMIDCPVCGAHYENSFAERFEIANDEKRSKDLLLELTKELKEIQSKINGENNKLLKTSSEVEKIEAILMQKKGDLQFKDIIDYSGKKQVKELFNERISELTKSIVENNGQKIVFDKKLKALENRARSVEITAAFQTYLTLYLKKLDVQTLSKDDYKAITTKIETRERGSALPRALLAYYYTFFNLMRDYSTTTFCPIIIDSPNQQEQDVEHIDKIMEFINSNQPEGSQMIFGLSEDYGVDFNCKVITLTEKYSLLNRSSFAEVNEEVFPKLEKLWFS